MPRCELFGGFKAVDSAEARASVEALVARNAAVLGRRQATSVAPPSSRKTPSSPGQMALLGVEVEAEAAE